MCMISHEKIGVLLSQKYISARIVKDRNACRSFHLYYLMVPIALTSDSTL